MSDADKSEGLKPQASERDGQERVVPMRLQRFLARAGAASRRGSENLMTAGRVRVNGEVVTELGSKVDPRCDRVTVDGVEVRLAAHATYLVLNKPAGYLTTMSDPHGRPCVASLVPTKRFPGLFPVGRLDGDTTGILLFTTNGNASQELLHPSRHVSKHYVALVEGTPNARDLNRLRTGIMLDDGPAQPAEVEILGPSSDLARCVAPDGNLGNRSVVGISIKEGRKHQVKRMFAATGHKVVRLHRDSFGPLTLKGLALGSWRELDETEVAQIEALVAEGVASRATRPNPAASGRKRAYGSNKKPYR
ncbi:MAG: pseudouridine synthase [Coriobacteriales bacterium]|nr:pseudouridine synthase [Coriobacteriales bacterium]